MRPLQTWTGSEWRSFVDGDENLKHLVIAGNFIEQVSLDPSLPVIAGNEVVDRVKEAHRRFSLDHPTR